MKRTLPVWVELLVCPECRGTLKEVAEGLVCERDQRLYPIVDGVPQMVEEAARVWSPPDSPDEP